MPRVQRTAEAREVEEPQETPLVKRRVREDSGSATKGGWDALSTLKSNKKWIGQEDKFKPSSEQVVVRFLENEPFAVYNEHFIRELKGSGMRISGTCAGEDCPLCDAGDSPQPKVLFNVVDLSKAKPGVTVWVMSATLANKFKALNDSKMTGPLTDRYYAVSKTGEKTSQPDILPIRERDLTNDMEIDPLSPETITTLNKRKFTPSFIDAPDFDHLEKLAVAYANLEG